MCGGGGEGAGYKAIGAHTDLCASLQQQLGNRISIPTRHHKKVPVPVKYVWGENVAKFYIWHVHMHAHV